MIKAVLFDLDGCLVDAGPWHYESLNAALVAHGYMPISPVEHQHGFDGLPTRIKLQHLVEKGVVRQDDVSSITALKQKETWRIIRNTLLFSPEKYCLLAGLKRYGYHVGIVSNAIYDTVSLVCEKMDISSLIDVFTTNEDGQPKPSPELYQLAIKRFSLMPEECLAVEDGEYGVQAAKGAGCRVLKVCDSLDVTPKTIWYAMEEQDYADNSCPNGRKREAIPGGRVYTP